MNLSTISQNYLHDLELPADNLDLDLVRSLQSRHIARYSFNSLAVLMGQEISLELEAIFNKIVSKRRGGYCFEHNKLVFNVLSELGFQVRILMAKVVNNLDIDAPRTHRFTLLTLAGEDYIVDAGFGPLGARYPVKLELNSEQDQGDAVYRVSQADTGGYCLQVLKAEGFYSLYTFDTNNYSEADCLPAHFYSHRHSDAVFVNNLVVCKKSFNSIHSLRNGRYFHIQGDITDITEITDADILHRLLVEVFDFDTDLAVAKFLYHRFAAGNK